jgi:2-oxo-4-hydroxy-4-carboxy-5-ureidoimidazoline decarboxylase
MDLPSFNALPHDAATEELLACCASRRWAAAVAGLRPYRDLDHLLAEADEVWRALDEDAWLEAIEAHPRIGERAAGDGAHARWSAGEQAEAQRSEQAVRDEIARLNVEYEERFEHVFLISAAGRSGEEILAELRRRLDNSLETELKIAADEQAKITRLRLERLIEERAQVPRYVL